VRTQTYFATPKFDTKTTTIHVYFRTQEPLFEGEALLPPIYVRTCACVFVCVFLILPTVNMNRNFSAQ